jgi:hypothetical protein
MKKEINNSTCRYCGATGEVFLSELKDDEPKPKKYFCLKLQCSENCRESQPDEMNILYVSEKLQDLKTWAVKNFISWDCITII